MQSSSDKLEVIERHYNGAPGMVIYEDNQPVLAMTIDIDPETKRISQIYNLRNPEKLKAFHLTDNPT